MSADELEDGPADRGDDATAAGATGAPEARRRRRRRRRRPGETAATMDGAPVPPPSGDAESGRERRTWSAREPRDQANAPDASIDAGGAEDSQRTAGRPAPLPEGRSAQPREPRSERRTAPREPRSERREPREPRSERREPREPRSERRAEPREPRSERREPRAEREPSRRNRNRNRGQHPDDPAAPRAADAARTDARTPARAPEPARAPALAELAWAETTRSGLFPALRPGEYFEDPPSDTSLIPWGSDDDAPTIEIMLAADLPTEGGADDVDPLTYPLIDAASAGVGGDVASVVGVRFVPGGRVQWCDAGDVAYTAGERVLVDSERTPRLGWIATPPTRRATRDRGLRRILRRATEHDLRGERGDDDERAKLLRLAKDTATALHLPLKVFRVELQGHGRGGKLNLYYTSDERLDLRELVRQLGNATGARIELRQLGVRDEAKAVGGIGSCGLSLCCTTWLPDFVPVSIKMAKDQGLVLSPTKVSGQCGRLKCCLVYEQAAYAELRKGLPKLGKRVIAPRGEGRVVEVDVLRQRVRVSYGMGDTEVVAATDIQPMFPSGSPPPRSTRGDAPADTPAGTPEPEPAHALEDPSADVPGPTDDPSSDDYQA